MKKYLISIILILLSTFIYAADEVWYYESQYGQNRYCRIVDLSDRDIWDDNGSTWAASPTWANTALAMTEDDGDDDVKGFYYCSFPDSTAGDYLVVVYSGTAGSASTTDSVVTSFAFHYDGSKEITQTGDSYAVVNNGTYGNSAIKGYVDDIGVAGAGLTALPWNPSWDAEVQSEAGEAFYKEAIGTPVEYSCAYFMNSISATVTSVTFGNSALKDLIDTAQADLDLYDTDAELATALWNAETASYGSAGSYGLLLETDLDASISSRSSHDDPDPSGYIDAAMSSRSSHSAADVLDVDISGYSGEGYAGTYIKNLFDNQGNWATATGFPSSSDYTSARAGYIDKLNVSGTLAHSDAAATYKATGFSTHSAADIWTADSRELSTPANYMADVSALATSADLATVDGIIDNIYTAFEFDVDVYRLTTNALEQGPSGGASAEEVVAALMADTGITAGGTYTYEDFCKAIGAYILGDWQDKGGDSSVQEILDWEDDTTVILEHTASESSPYKQVTKK